MYWSQKVPGMKCHIRKATPWHSCAQARQTEVEQKKLKRGSTCGCLHLFPKKYKGYDALAARGYKLKDNNLE